MFQKHNQHDIEFDVNWKTTTITTHLCLSTWTTETPVRSWRTASVTGTSIYWQVWTVKQWLTRPHVLLNSPSYVIVHVYQTHILFIN